MIPMQTLSCAVRPFSTLQARASSPGAASTSAKSPTGSGGSSVYCISAYSVGNSIPTGGSRLRSIVSIVKESTRSVWVSPVRGSVSGTVLPGSAVNVPPSTASFSAVMVNSTVSGFNFPPFHRQHTRQMAQPQSRSSS